MYSILEINKKKLIQSIKDSRLDTSKIKRYFNMKQRDGPSKTINGNKCG